MGASSSTTGLSQAEPEVSALRASIPSAAEFHGGKYSDGSGPMARVSYDTLSEHTPDRIWIDGGDLSDRWVAFDWRIAEDLIAAIRAAASAIEAAKAGETGTGSTEGESAAPTGETPQ